MKSLIAFLFGVALALFLLDRYIETIREPFPLADCFDYMALEYNPAGMT